MTQRRRNVRGSLAVAAVVLGALTLNACGGDSSPGATTGSGINSKQLVIADYGGTTREARDSWVKDFEQETGVRVVFADADSAKIPIFAERGRAEWDLIDSAPEDVVKWADAGYLEALPDDIPRPSTLAPEITEYAAAYNNGVGIVYNSDKATSAPQSWDDFFDVEGHPGKRAIPSYSVYLEEGALLADGVPCDQLYPLDFDRAYKKLDTLRGHTVVWSTYAQGLQYVIQGTADMALLTDGRAMEAKKQGFPVEFVWNEAIGFPSGLVVLADAPHKDAAIEFVRYWAEHPEVQVEFAKGSGYTPAFPDAIKQLPESVEAVGTPKHADQACDLQAYKGADQVDEKYERYAKWVASL